MNSYNSRTVDTRSFPVKRNWDKMVYKISMVSFVAIFTTSGFGNHFFGFVLPTDFATLIIYFIFLVQLCTSSLKFSKLLLLTWLYIFTQTFLLNSTYIDFPSSLKHFIGLILFSLVAFSFISKNRHKLLSVMQTYYKFCFFLVCLAILQLIIFIVAGYSFLPQNIITGVLVFGGSSELIAEIFGIFPRAVGLSTEPAHYVALLLPAAYISLHTLTGTGHIFQIYNKPVALVILFGFIISFSIVGYFGLALCLVSIFRKKIRTNFFKTGMYLMIFAGLFYLILRSPIGEKVYSFITVSKDITGSEYTSGDQTSFALLSNVMVATRGLEISNYLGTGLNSHIITYDATISNIFLLSQIPNELNKDNAGALFIRIPSELGIPGLLAFVWFLFHFKIKNVKSKTLVDGLNSMCLVFLIMYCARTGHYLNMLFMFFLAMYYYTYLVSKEQTRA